MSLTELDQPNRADSNPEVPPPEPDPGASRGATASGSSPGSVRPDTLRAVKLSLAQQAVALFLAALLLDGGATVRTCAVAALASWAATGLILGRRRRSPTRTDLVVIRYGFWAALILVRGVTPIVWRVTGQGR